MLKYHLYALSCGKAMSQLVKNNTNKEPNNQRDCVNIMDKKLRSTKLIY